MPLTKTPSLAIFSTGIGPEHVQGQGRPSNDTLLWSGLAITSPGLCNNGSKTKVSNTQEENKQARTTVTNWKRTTTNRRKQTKH